MEQSELSTAQPDAGDDFLSSLRLDQSYMEATLGVRRVLNTVPVRKPNKQDFFRVHPDHSLDCYSVELKAEGEIYFVTPELAQLIAEFCEPVRLRLCVTRQGVVFLWPIKLPRDDRRSDDWRRSAAEAAHLAESRWIRLTAHMSLGAYETFEAVADLGDPKWPPESWTEIVKIALRDRRIDDANHAVIRQLLGKV
jgi:hypothetical protein